MSRLLVVGDAAGQLAHGLHLLRLLQPLRQRTPLGFVTGDDDEPGEADRLLVNRPDRGAREKHRAVVALARVFVVEVAGLPRFGEQRAELQVAAPVERRRRGANHQLGGGAENHVGAGLPRQNRAGVVDEQHRVIADALENAREPHLAVAQAHRRRSLLHRAFGFDQARVVQRQRRLAAEHLDELEIVGGEQPIFLTTISTPHWRSALPIGTDQTCGRGAGHFGRSGSQSRARPARAPRCRLCPTRPMAGRTSAPERRVAAGDGAGRRAALRRTGYCARSRPRPGRRRGRDHRHEARVHPAVAGCRDDGRATLLLHRAQLAAARPGRRSSTRRRRRQAVDGGSAGCGHCRRTPRPKMIAMKTRTRCERREPTAPATPDARCASRERPRRISPAKARSERDHRRQCAWPVSARPARPLHW